jgi:hypothetical protein
MRLEGWSKIARALLNDKPRCYAAFIWPSFRGASETERTRNLEIPGLHLTVHPGMTNDESQRATTTVVPTETRW